MKFLGGVGRGPWNSQLDFGGDPDHDLDPGIFRRIVWFVTAQYTAPVQFECPF